MQYKFIQNQWSGRADFPVTAVKGESCPCPTAQLQQGRRGSRPLIHSSTRQPAG
jgi:hypothetical protein